MNFKFNLSVLKNKDVVFHWNINNNDKEYGGKILSVKNKKKNYTFTFYDNSKLQTTDTILLRCKIRKEEDVIHIYYDDTCNIISGIAGFSMNDTYGFPIEITQEILNEDSYEIDMEGYYVLKELQKEMSNGTFSNKDGWNSK